MKGTRALTTSAVLSALAYVLLLFGNATVMLEFCALALVSFLLLFLWLLTSRRYAILSYCVVSVLSLLFLPDKTTAILYCGFTGLYPLLKFALERLPRFFSWILKFLWANLAAACAYLLWKYVFLVPDLTDGWVLLLATAVLFHLTFFLYDRALSRFLRIYMERIEPRIARFLR